jgi:hypothetical protein
MFIAAHKFHLALVLRLFYASLLAWLRLTCQPPISDGNPNLRPLAHPGSQLGRKTRTGFVIVVILLSSLLPLVQYIFIDVW